MTMSCARSTNDVVGLEGGGRKAASRVGECRCVCERESFGSLGFDAPVGATELREPVHGRAVLLVSPGELEPEFLLCFLRRGAAAGREHAQGGIAVRRELAQGALQLAQLVQYLARQCLQGRSTQSRYSGRL